MVLGKRRQQPVPGNLRAQRRFKPKKDLKLKPSTSQRVTRG